MKYITSIIYNGPLTFTTPVYVQETAKPLSYTAQLLLYIPINRQINFQCSYFHGEIWVNK